MLAAVCDILAASGIAVAGRATDGAEALALIEAERPEIAVLDLRMPQLGGIDVSRRVATSVPETQVILYTAYAEQALLVEALDAGARGFVLKEAPSADLVRAVRLVAAGGTYVDPVLAGVLAEAALKRELPVLTQREREVLRLLAAGMTNESAGKRLFISPETVRTHVRTAMSKLDADTRTAAVASALRQSLIA